MTDKIVKIRLKLGQFELDYEGDAGFLEEGIFNLLGKTAEFYTANQDSISAASELPKRLARSPATAAPPP